MKSNTLLGLYFLGILCFYCSCKSENQKFSELIINRDLEGVYKFKEKYPHTIYNVDSLIQILEYNKIQNSEDINALRDFSEKFPYSPFIDSVQMRMSNIEWTSIKESPDAEKVASFMDKYPRSRFYEQAENWLYENYWLGEVIDKRDGHKYNWVRIGEQIWMTQNLNFSIEPSCPKEVDGRIDMEAGRAYDRSIIWDACLDGWSIPTLEDWYTMIFNFDAYLGVNDDRNTPGLYCLTLRIDAGQWQSGSPFRPYLKFNYSDDKDFYKCRRIFINGGSYWTKTYSPNYDTSNDIRIPYCMHFESTKWNDGIERLSYMYNNITAPKSLYPLRCVKKFKDSKLNNSNTNNFMPYNSESITIDEHVYRKEDLLQDGIYIPIGQNPDDIKNSIIIKYVGSKMFFFSYRKGHNSDYWMYYNIYNSEKDGHFSCVLFSNYITKRVVGEFFIRNKDTIVLSEMSEPTIEYKLIPNLRVSFTE